MTKVLLADDNDFYAKHLTCHLEAMGAEVIRAWDAKEAIGLLENNMYDFDGIITDISMETNVSGLKVLRKAKKQKFEGVLAVATTGINTPLTFTLNRYILGMLYGADYLIPKLPIQQQHKILWLEP